MVNWAGIRFSEKSFEVRFCAALTAAAMPFNRNPQWFGMTQAEERKNGIDTMIDTGGRLLVFQFKAKRRSRFHLERHQWQNLDRIDSAFPRSAYYVFPEAADLAQAMSPSCLLKEAWLCSPSTIGNLFAQNTKSVSVRLEPLWGHLVKLRPKRLARVRNVCQALGCYCPPAGSKWMHPGKFNAWLGLAADPFHLGAGILPGDDEAAPIGIPLGRSDDGEPGTVTISSTEQFEALLGEQAYSNLGPGLSGLFIPSPRSRDIR